MLTRRMFIGALTAELAEASLGGFSEAVLAQRAGFVMGPPGTVWLNANEYPDGPREGNRSFANNLPPETYLLVDVARHHRRQERRIEISTRSKRGSEVVKFYFRSAFSSNDLA